MTLRLEGRVAVITGGASGIGEGTVRRFVQEGASVVIADRQRDLGIALVAELGTASRFVATDVARDADVRVAVDTAVAEFGRLDVMVNNAAVLGVRGPIAETSDDAWDGTVAVLLRGVYLGMKHAARVMLGQGSGSIISTASTAGVIGGLGPHCYTACKHAVIGLTKSVAIELGPSGIRVNALSPGGTVTPMTAAALSGDATKLAEADTAISSRTLLGFSALPADMADAVLFLAGEESRFMTGQNLIIDAGQTINAGNGHFYRRKVHEG